MDEFIKKWKNDKKYKAKIKLIGYFVFVIAVSIYAISVSNNKELHKNNVHSNELNNQQQEDTIKIPNNYTYKIDISIDDKNYQYYGQKLHNEKTINKVVDETTTKYIYQNNEYYLEDNNIFIKTTKEEVYDIINYNYINLDNINAYLSKSTKEGNQYLIYLKDIILNNDTNDYFKILINGNQINIDYTPLMQQFNNNIEKYKVSIVIQEIE